MKMLTAGLWKTKEKDEDESHLLQRDEDAHCWTMDDKGERSEGKSSIVEGHMKMYTARLWTTKEKDQSESRRLQRDILTMYTARLSL